MAESNHAKYPYEILGALLKKLREGKKESLADVSGAVEMDEAVIADYEKGQKRPSEDILLLLMNHFGVQDDRAEELWDIAGYESTSQDQEGRAPHDDESFERRAQQTMMVMLDPRVMYSDGIEVFASNEGVVMNFHQRIGVSGQPLVVSRIGMSREQARTFMGLIHKVLYDMDNPPVDKRLGDGSNS
ncbi:MAG: family transcriptional regulator [Patescibacteria group bacterium]|nr:helix-turn-helix domain-containing protein [Candidatus Saccharibacteria bacterium]MDQ5963247.1 family transcriptional regulator [Patescibacteria group bacterium]